MSVLSIVPLRIAVASIWPALNSESVMIVLFAVEFIIAELSIVELVRTTLFPVPSLNSEFVMTTLLATLSNNLEDVIVTLLAVLSRSSELVMTKLFAVPSSKSVLVKILLLPVPDEKSENVIVTLFAVLSNISPAVKVDAAMAILLATELVIMVSSIVPRTKLVSSISELSMSTLFRRESDILTPEIVPPVIVILEKISY